jgi:hypothetical protein
MLEAPSSSAVLGPNPFTEWRIDNFNQMHPAFSLLSLLWEAVSGDIRVPAVDNLWLIDYRVRRKDRTAAPQENTAASATRHRFAGKDCAFTEVRQEDPE